MTSGCVKDDRILKLWNLSLSYLRWQGDNCVSSNLHHQIQTHMCTNILLVWAVMQNNYNGLLTVTKQTLNKVQLPDHRSFPRYPWNSLMTVFNASDTIVAVGPFDLLNLHELLVSIYSKILKLKQLSPEKVYDDSVNSGILKVKKYKWKKRKKERKKM